MADYICMGILELGGTLRKRELQIKNLANNEIRAHELWLWSRRLNVLAMRPLTNERLNANLFYLCYLY